MCFDIHKSIGNLSKNRRMFHSEADFKFALAWQLKTDNPLLEVYLEMPFDIDRFRCYIDLVLKSQFISIGLELKYITKNLVHEEYNLKTHAATGQRRYDVYRDIRRLEQLKESRRINEGYMILLTNELSYLKAPSSTAIGHQFNFANKHEILPKSYDWDWGKSEEKSQDQQKAYAGKSRLNEIIISNTYKCEWKKWNDDSKDNKEFKYLILKI